MKNAVRSSTQLCDELGLGIEDISLSIRGERQFPVFVPREFLSRMRPGDPNDPLLLQVIPRKEESNSDPEFVLDPVGDQFVEVEQGLLHKYHGRVLMLVSGACAVHCRYCFRRHYPYQTTPKSISAWSRAFDYIAKDESIHEVLLSGGDPLSLSDVQLSELVQKLDSIPHLRRLRIHTRFPVVIPQRIDDSFCEWFAKSRLTQWIVLHINHAQEIDASLIQSVKRLKDCGATVLNQTVLLRDINDNLTALLQLCETLVDIGVVPYYLHQLDRVSGAMHFEANWESGLELVQRLNERLPGYAVPKYVNEVAGEASKTAVQAVAHRL